MKHIHILGICGTFMGSLAILARQAGFKVSGCDRNVYPPMSTQLENQGIEIIQGYETDQLNLNPDLYVIGNVVSRGNYPLMEAILNANLPFCSGPDFLKQHILHDKHVLAVSGTHGKTTTSSMLTWLLEVAGLNPSYLIGGVPNNFEASARLTNSKYFVIEADEYDTAFFDKRSKFIHYRPQTLIINNLEFDHADIFRDLEDIQRQFSNLLRIIPSNGQVIANNMASIQSIIEKTPWVNVQWFKDSNLHNQTTDTTNPIDSAWQITPGKHSQQFSIQSPSQTIIMDWQVLGTHNQCNAMAACLAAHSIGVDWHIMQQALASFAGIKRRMEVKGQVNNITVYDDFAHHPTAIEQTLNGLRKKIGQARIIAILEPRSNTMKMGAIRDALPASMQIADHKIIYGAQSGKDALSWNPQELFPHSQDTQTFSDMAQLLAYIKQISKPGDHILCMSNGSFDGIHQKLLDVLA